MRRYARVFAWYALRILALPVTLPVRLLTAAHRERVWQAQEYAKARHKSVTVTYKDGTTEEFNGVWSWPHDKQFQTLHTDTETFLIPVERVHEIVVRRAY